ncbi:hypothetical protein [Streptomyces cylindrosporus]|uniref:Uncharacterized protein n=1 Tax=Streptomyces cylindrosporus TaxID=2927583 RepID=A0ABS9Y311_9ACTN|nr:hypothetical protein [Streptomyces cylindrosporus]MCI3271379.1 hypothetical protein [Streptomyces cylindrosporus]
MTTPQTRGAPEDEVDLPQLGELLVASAKNDRDRAAAQALAEEETLLAHDGVRRALVVKEGGRMTAVWERLMGRLYTLGLDDQQRAFLGLVLSMVGIGQVSLTAVESLDERRLIIMQRAILRLAGNDRIAVGTRL